MPSLQFTLPAGAVTAVALDAIASRLPVPLLGIEGLPAVEPFLSRSWAFVHELSTAFAGGRRTSEPIIRVDVTTAEGLVDEDGKRAIAEEITGAFVDESGVAAEQVLVIIHESPALGFGGRLGTADDVRALASTATVPSSPETWPSSHRAAFARGRETRCTATVRSSA